MPNKRSTLGPEWPNLHKRKKTIGEKLQNSYIIAEHVSCKKIYTKYVENM